MNNFKGQVLAKHNTACHHCGRVVGPSFPVKVMYMQYGAGGGQFCSNTCCKAAYDAVTAANPELKTKTEHIFKGFK